MSRLIAAVSLLLLSTISSGQTGGAWPTSTVWSITGPLTITQVGNDVDQYGMGNTGFVFLNVTPVGATTCGYGGLYIPFYNLAAPNFTPSYATGLNPAAKSLYNEILAASLVGRPLNRVDYWQLAVYPYMCVLKLAY